MHLALQIDEIIRMICEHVYLQDQGKAVLANLACVQKGLGNVALDCLWRDISGRALLCLVLISYEEYRDKEVFPQSSGQWNRIYQYSSRIRTIRCRDAEPWADMDLEGIVSVLALRPPRSSPLPRLEEIQWFLQPWVLPPRELTAYIVPSIKCFTIRTKAVEDRHLIDDVMGEMLSRLLEVQASLQKLHLLFRWYKLPLSAFLQNKLVTLLQFSGGLTHVSIHSTRVLMRILGTLPSLKFLRLVRIRRKDFRSHVDNVEPSGVLFPALETLQIGLNSLALGTALLKGFQCYARYKIDIFCSRTPCTSDDISAFLEVATDPIRSHSLTEFSFYYHGLTEEQNPQIKLCHLRRLLALRNLEMFKFVNSHVLSIDDHDMETLASSWPNIAKLNLCLKWEKEGLRYFESRITLCGLTHLATLPRLAKLEIAVTVPNVDIIESAPILGTSRSPLETLRVGFSAIGADCTAAVVSFLTQNFPRLQRLDQYIALEEHADVLKAVEKRWKDVGKGVEEHARNSDASIVAPV